MTPDALPVILDWLSELPPEVAVPSGIATIGVYHLRGIRQDSRKALRILRGEEDIEHDDGLIGRVEEIDERSRENADRIRQALRGDHGE